jgi:hypothetical protein
LNVPVEPGVPEGRDALVRRAVLLELVIPSQPSAANRPLTRRPRHPAGPLVSHG